MKWSKSLFFFFSSFRLPYSRTHLAKLASNRVRCTKKLAFTPPSESGFFFFPHQIRYFQQQLHDPCWNYRVHWAELRIPHSQSIRESNRPVTISSLFVLIHISRLIINIIFSSYWIHVGLVLQQLSGLTDGYAAVAPADQRLGQMEIALLNMNGDLEELMVGTKHIKPASFAELSKRLRRSHCSGLVKVAPDFHELYAAHNTYEMNFILLLLLLLFLTIN